MIGKCIQQRIQLFFNTHKVVGAGLFPVPTFSHLNLKATLQGRHYSLKTLRFVEIKFSVFGPFSWQVAGALGKSYLGTRFFCIGNSGKT